MVCFQGNVLVDTGYQPLLSDLGLAGFAEVKGSLAYETASAGTMRWCSPEMIKGDVRRTPAADVYALGCTIIEVRKF